MSVGANGSPSGLSLSGNVPDVGTLPGFLVQEAEELLDEEALLDYVHPADVVALDEGATEEPLQSGGSPQAMVELLLRNARAVMHFVPHGGEQFRQLLAAITVWQQRESGESIAVDTQTTEEGNGGEPPAAAQWVPPLDAEQCPSICPQLSVSQSKSPLMVSVATASTAAMAC